MVAQSQQLFLTSLAALEMSEKAGMGRFAGVAMKGAVVLTLTSGKCDWSLAIVIDGWYVWGTERGNERIYE